MGNAIFLCRRPDRSGIITLYGTRFQLSDFQPTIYSAVWIILEVGQEMVIRDEKQNLLNFTQIGKKETINGQN